MLNPFREVNWQPNLSERRRFAVSLLIGFPCVAIVLGATLGWRGGDLRFPLVLGAGGAALGLVLWLLPRIARPFYVVWYGFACCIGLVVGNVLLAAVYYLVFTPTGLILRAIGRSSLTKRFDRNAKTYWRDAPRPDAPERYYRQF